MFILKSGLKWLKLYSSTPDMFSLIKKSTFTAPASPISYERRSLSNSIGIYEWREQLNYQDIFLSERADWFSVEGLAISTA